jgi:hypothetical protein
MSKEVWTGSWEGVCEINTKHRFHGDIMTPIKPGGASLTKVCCGRPVKYKKKMQTVEIADKIKDDS